MLSKHFEYYVNQGGKSISQAKNITQKLMKTISSLKTLYCNITFLHTLLVLARPEVNSSK